MITTDQIADHITGNQAYRAEAIVRAAEVSEFRKGHAWTTGMTDAAIIVFLRTRAAIAESRA